MPHLQLTHRQNYTTLHLTRPKVNALNPALVRELTEAVASVRDDDTRGLIITGRSDIFSAGLDVIELIELDRNGIRQFFRDFNRLYTDLVRFPGPLVFAITGHCPAGGTVLALTGDYRIMDQDERYHIGLNEMAVDVQISHNLIDAYAYWIGTGRANEYILEGRLLNGPQAHAVGLVNELAPADEVLSRAETKMRHYLTAHPTIFRNTKQKLRRDWIERLDRHGEADLEQFVEVWFTPSVRERMEALVAKLLGKGKAG